MFGSDSDVCVDRRHTHTKTKLGVKVDHLRKREYVYIPDRSGPVIDHYAVKRTDQFWPFQYKVVF